jgi:hypothetical protein
VAASGSGAWHRGGAGDRLGGDGGLDLHRPARLMVVERQRISFASIGVQPFSRQRCGQGLAQDCSFSADFGANGWAMRNPCFLLTTATPSGAVSSLGASSWLYRCFPTLSAGGNPRFGLPDRTAAAPQCRPLLGGVV